MYKLYLLKRLAEDILMLPMIGIGRLIALFKPLDKEYKVFFFFPFYHVGGAEKVHAQVAKACGGADCIIFFTKKSGDTLFWDEFAASGCVMKDISKHTDNKWLYFKNIIYRGILSGYINKQKQRPVVFNGQCNFGYKISPWIRKEITQLELIHSLCSFSYIRIPFLPFITKTVMISTVRIQEHLELYKRYGIPAEYDSRIQFIMNAIELPPRQQKEQHDRLTALYVGRCTAEKRVPLIASAAKKLSENSNNVKVQFMGEVSSAIPQDLHDYCHFWGALSDTIKIDGIYRNADILLLVSDTEGFPMVIMEAMTRGLAIISTAVGEIPLHIKNGVNGFLIENVSDAEGVVQQVIQHVETLNKERVLLNRISDNNMEYAYEHFGMDRFNKEYQQLFLEANGS